MILKGSKSKFTWSASISCSYLEKIFCVFLRTKEKLQNKDCNQVKSKIKPGMPPQMETKNLEKKIRNVHMKTCI